jgi:hypothetical protein
LGYIVGAVLHHRGDPDRTPIVFAFNEVLHRFGRRGGGRAHCGDRDTGHLMGYGAEGQRTEP